MSKELKVKLKSSDDELFEVEEIVALESQTIKDMVEATGTESVIPLSNVSSNILSKVIEYCRYHALEVPKGGEDKPGLSEDEVKTWDSEFFNVDQATVFDLVLAANNLKIKSLLDRACQTVHDMIKGKTPEEVRMFFNINDNFFTPEKKEEIKRENPWAFE